MSNYRTTKRTRSSHFINEIKRAKEPKELKRMKKINPKPKPKLRKAFVPKKLVLRKPINPKNIERDILEFLPLTSANIFRQALVELQKELGF